MKPYIELLAFLDAQKVSQTSSVQVNQFPTHSITNLIFLKFVFIKHYIRTWALDQISEYKCQDYHLKDEIVR